MLIVKKTMNSVFVDFDYSSTVDFADFCVLAQHWLKN
jgi:hypothetical protein